MVTPLKYEVSRPAALHEYLRNSLFKLLILGTLLIMIGFQALFPSLMISHTLTGDRHVFVNSPYNIALHLGYNGMLIGLAWYLWRKKKDRYKAGVLLIAVGYYLFALIPQLLAERVEVTPLRMTHRRNSSDIFLNLNVAFDDIQSAVELLRANGSRGYRFRLRNGRTADLPNEDVVNAARDVIAQRLRDRSIPVTVEIVQPKRD